MVTTPDLTSTDAVQPFFPIFSPLQLQCHPILSFSIMPLTPPTPPPQFITFYNNLGHLSPILYPSLLSHLSPSSFFIPLPYLLMCDLSNLFFNKPSFSFQYSLTLHHLKWIHVVWKKGLIRILTYNYTNSVTVLECSTWKNIYLSTEIISMCKKV